MVVTWTEAGGWLAPPDGPASPVTPPLPSGNGASSMQMRSCPGVRFRLSELLAQQNLREQLLGKTEKGRLAGPRLR